MYIVIHCLLLVVRFISMLNIGFHKNNINDTIIYCVWCIGQHIMMYSNIIVINNYDILHVIANIMCLCIIKHPGPNASTVSTPTTTNERLPAQPKERLPRIPNSTVSRGCTGNSVIRWYGNKCAHLSSHQIIIFPSWYFDTPFQLPYKNTLVPPCMTHGQRSGWK